MSRNRPGWSALSIIRPLKVISISSSIDCCGQFGSGKAGPARLEFAERKFLRLGNRWISRRRLDGMYFDRFDSHRFSPSFLKTESDTALSGDASCACDQG
jgi:hypothetical protein